MRLIIPGNDLLATAKCRTFEEAVVQSAEALERQKQSGKQKREWLQNKITGSR